MGLVRLYCTVTELFYDWDPEKNVRLLEKRGVSFEMVVAAIESGGLLDILQNTQPRAHQKVYIVLLEEYVYVVPFVEDSEKIFLKTIYPSRKMHKLYYEKKE
jgi:uncharacterized DUF497 family protein